MFWHMPSIISNIEPLLDKEGVTFEEIIEEESVIQECKAQNQKLVAYLVQDAIVDQIVSRVVTEPSPELPNQTRYRHANVCCELLTSDVDPLNAALVADNRHLDRLYAFLQGDQPLNPLLASFFSKVMQLIARKQADRLLAYLSGRDDFVDLVIRHMGTSAVMDFLVSVVTMRCGGGEDSGGPLQQQSLAAGAWLSQCGLTDKLLATLAADRTAEEQYNGAQCLASVIAYCRDLAAQGSDSRTAATAASVAPAPNSLLEQLESGETAAKLLGRMLDCEQPTESAVAAGTQVLLALLDGRRSSADHCSASGDYPSLMSAPPPPPASSQQQSEAERLAGAALNVIEATAPRLPQLVGLLSKPPPHRLPSMPTTAGELTPPLGQCRLHIARLFQSLLSTNSALAGRAIAASGALPALLGLMLDYPWNTFLHQAVEQSAECVLKTQPVNEDQVEAQTALQRQLLLDSNLPGRLLDAFARLDAAGRRLGFLGHLARLANCLNDALAAGAAKDPRSPLSELFGQLDEDLRQRWQAWTEGELADMNKRSVITTSPLSSQEDDCTPYTMDPSPLQALHHAYAEFQAKQLTCNFPDHFGFQEDEFNEAYDRVEAIFSDKVSNLDFSTPTPEDAENASMFDQACNSQIQQFDDDEDNDEDEAAAGGGDASQMSTTVGNADAMARVSDLRLPRSPSNQEEEDDEDDDDIHNKNDNATAMKFREDIVGNRGGVNDEEIDVDLDVNIINDEDDEDEDEDEEEEEGIGPAVILSGARRKAEAAAAAAVGEQQPDVFVAASLDPPAAAADADADSSAAPAAAGGDGEGESEWAEFTNLEQLMLPVENATVDSSSDSVSQEDVVAP